MKLDKHPGFHIEFMHDLPPFTAVMLDGDIAPTGVRPNDEGGQIRIQPRTAHGIQREGIILPFRKMTSKKSADAFVYFAEDLRHQWRLDAQDCAALFDV